MFTKEYLRLLNIKNIYYKTFGGITTLIQILNMNENLVTVITSGNISDKGILNIEFNNDNNVQIFVSVIKDFSEINTFTFFYEDPLPCDLISSLKKLNNLINKSEIRKELRYDIGLDNWQQFGLVKPDVTLSVNNQIIKCIINNVSIHGALLTGLRASYNIGDKVLFNCNFIEKEIKQLSIIINITKSNTNYYKYSLRFLEPLTLIWCNHIIDYGDYLENLLSC